MEEREEGKRKLISIFYVAITLTSIYFISLTVNKKYSYKKAVVFQLIGGSIVLLIQIIYLFWDKIK